MRSDIFHGIVLNLKNSGKSDILVSIMTSDGELLLSLAKNVRKKNSAIAGSLVLGNIVEIKVLNGYSLPILIESKVLQSSYFSITDHLDLSCFFIVLEVLLKFCYPGKENLKLYNIAENYIKSSNKAADLPNFLIDVMKVEGLLDESKLSTNLAKLGLDSKNHKDKQISQASKVEKDLDMIKCLISYLEEVSEFVLKTKQMIL